eukprot:7573820-Karenia_brevis.AAC.1
MHAMLSFHHGGHQWWLDNITDQDYERIFGMMKNQHVCDHYGVSIHGMHCWKNGNLSTFHRSCASVICNPETYRQLHIKAKIYGKDSTSPKFNKTRCIMPLCSFLMYVDALLANCVQKFIQGHLPSIRGVYVGALKGTPTNEIHLQNRLIIEKGLDSKSQASIAQGDIETYYDKLPMCSICDWLAAKGFPMQL